MAGPSNVSNMVVGLDIGTSKVVAIVGQPTDDGGIEIAGIGSHPSRGMKKGVVINIESTVQSIQRAVEEAELMAGCDIHSVYVGIAGSHISSMNSDGVVAIKEREVTPSDIDRVIDSARARAISEGQRILHVLPQEFALNHVKLEKRHQVILEKKTHCLLILKMLSEGKHFIKMKQSRLRVKCVTVFEGTEMDGLPVG